MWDLIVSVPDHCLSFYFSEYASFVSFYGVPKGHCLVWGFFFSGKIRTRCSQNMRHLV